MRLLTPLVPDPAAPLARANPVAKLGAALVLLLVLFASLDLVTAAVIGVAMLALLPWSGLRPSTMAARWWLIGLSAVSVAIANTLLAAEQTGPPLLEIGPIRIGAGTALNGLGLAVRLLAIAMVGLLATATSDPTELADALIAQLRAPPRFAIGALAALRLVPLLAVEWQTIGMARRARGVEAGRSPLAALRLLAGRLLALLVAAVRRAARMAIAMDARGFGALACRTSARESRMRPVDWAWIGGAVLLAALAIALSVAVGSWRFLIG
jgi:energy-coupling factor transport system permease protein